MRSDRHCGRFFSALICFQSKPYQRRPPFRTTVKFLRKNGKFNLVIAVKWVFSIYRYDYLIGYFYIEKLSPIFSTHVQCVRTLIIWQITSLSFGDDNIKSHIALWKIELNVQH